MTKITSLDRTSTMNLTSLLNEDLKAIGEKYGIALRINGGKLATDTACTLKLEVTIAGTGTVRQQRTTDALEEYAAIYLRDIDIKKPLKHRTLGDIMIVGWNAKAWKTPVLAKSANDGKTYRFTVDAIISLAKYTSNTK